MRTAPSKFWTFLIALFMGWASQRSDRISCAADAGITLDKRHLAPCCWATRSTYTLTAGNQRATPWPT